MNMRYYDKVPYKYFDLMAKLWPIIISIIVVTVAYGVTRNTVAEDHVVVRDLEKRMTTVEAVIPTMSQDIRDMKMMMIKQWGKK